VILQRPLAHHRWLDKRPLTAHRSAMPFSGVELADLLSVRGASDARVGSLECVEQITDPFRQPDVAVPIRKGCSEARPLLLVKRDGSGSPDLELLADRLAIGDEDELLEDGVTFVQGDLDEFVRQPDENAFEPVRFHRATLYPEGRDIIDPLRGEQACESYKHSSMRVDRAAVERHDRRDVRRLPTGALTFLGTHDSSVVVSHVRQVVTSLRVAASNGDIRRAQLAWGATISAEWAHFVGLGVFAYGHGGSTAVGVAGVVRLLPAAVVAPFASSLGDRFRRERFLLGLALAGSAALAVSAIGAVMDDRVVVFGSAAAVGICSTLFRPALIALLPSLARTAQELIAANGASSTIESLGTLAGPLAAGVLVAFADVTTVFVVAALVLLASVAVVARVSVEGSVPTRSADAGLGVWRGFEAMSHAPHARLLVGLIASQTFIRGCLNVLLVVTSYQVLHRGPSGVGYLTAALGAGGLIGALGAVSLRGARLAPPFALGLVFWGVPIMLVAPLPYPATVVLLLAAVGAANSIVDVAGFTLLQRTVPDAVLTRVLGVTWGLAMGAVALGSSVAPAVLSLVGLRPAFIIVGAVLPVLVLFAYRRLNTIDAQVAPSEQLGLIEGVTLFAPLSLVAKQRIASRLVPLELASGDLVVRAGATGDRFYIVDSGSVEIDLGSRTVHSGPGEFFGEIALLRDVPRTATVRASSETRLYALERDDFLAAVTGHSRAHTEANAVAATRLAST
jgi:MFS transporter/cyclic nucleotide-binding protein